MSEESPPAAVPDLDAIEARIRRGIDAARQRNPDVAPEDFDAVVHTFVHRTDALALVAHARALRTQVAELESDLVRLHAHNVWLRKAITTAIERVFDEDGCDLCDLSPGIDHADWCIVPLLTDALALPDAE